MSASGTGTGIGYCSSLNSMTGSGGYNLNAKNFYFAGNGSGSAANNVIIGNTCGYTPLAKLDIAQSSGSTNTKGIFVTNTDLSSGVAGNPVPVIGIESYMPLPTSNSYYRVAGWFEADDPTVVMTHTVPSLGYAIFVPQKYNGPLTLPTSGGTVDIGYRYTLDVPTFLLKVNGRINTPSWTSPSDTILKKDVAPFNYGIKAVRKLNPISYKYNGIGGFDSSTTYIGLIAEDLKRNVPDGVVPSLIIKDTITHDTQTVENICQEAVLYTSINAIKQVDSTVTSNHKNDSIALAKQLLTNDSLRYSLDSLRSAFKSYIICLNSLCDGHSPHHSGGNENIGDTNIQNVTLSSADAPLLYQNIPNPFTSGTKINYYLPQGTAGATIVFYDNYGNQIKQVQLSQTGNGTLNITPDNLTNGIYSYSLIVNGNVIDTKRMVLQK